MPKYFWFKVFPSSMLVFILVFCFFQKTLIRGFKVHFNLLSDAFECLELQFSKGNSEFGISGSMD